MVSSASQSYCSECVVDSILPLCGTSVLLKRREHHRIGRDRAAGLLGMLAVVQADAQDLAGAGIGHRYLADFSDTVAPALGLAQALATSAWTFLPPARISTTDFGPRGICLLRSMTLPSPILTPTDRLCRRY